MLSVICMTLLICICMISYVCNVCILNKFLALLCQLYDFAWHFSSSFSFFFVLGGQHWWAYACTGNLPVSFSLANKVLSFVRSYVDLQWRVTCVYVWQRGALCGRPWTPRLRRSATRRRCRYVGGQQQGRSSSARSSNGETQRYYLRLRV